MKKSKFKNKKTLEKLMRWMKIKKMIYSMKIQMN